MVNTRSEDARRFKNLQDDATTSNDPQATISLLNVRIAQMSKSMETLTKQNATLIRRISEHSHTTTVVREGISEGEREVHSSYRDGRWEEDEDREDPNYNQEEGNDWDVH